MSSPVIDDIRILEMRDIIAPQELLAALPVDENTAAHIVESRQAVESVICRCQKLFVIILISLALSGCGGGGSGVSSSPDNPPVNLPDDPPDNPPVNPPDNPPDNPPVNPSADPGTSPVGDPNFVESSLTDSHSDRINRIRTSIGKRGSVTQSTNVDESGNTLDTVNVEVVRISNVLNYKLEYKRDSDTAKITVFNNITSTDPAVNFIEAASGNGRDAGFRYFAISREIDMDGDSNNDGTFGIAMYNAGTSTAYYASGLYLYVPDIGDNIILGAFADTTREISTMSSTGSATYQGVATGILTANKPGDDLEIYQINGNIILDATFGATRQISGEVRDLYVYDYRPAPHLNPSQAMVTGAISLPPANIGSNGFFTGAFSGSLAGKFDSADNLFSVGITGNWGGQFGYGHTNIPEHHKVAGTLGGGAAEEGIEINMLMSFITGARSFNNIDYVESYLADNGGRRLNNIRASAARTGSGYTRSTKVDDSGNTRDAVDIEITGDPNNPIYKLEYQPDPGASAATVFHFKARDEVSINGNTEFNPIYRSLHAKDLDLRYLEDYREVDIDGDDNIDGQFAAVVYSTYNEVNDTDYFAGGFWLYAPENGRGGIVIGAFSDGPARFTDIARLTGTATYQGSAIGILSHAESGLSYARIYEVDSDIELNVEFGATPKISGTLRNIVQSENIEGLYQVNDIMLAEAAIQNDGSFTAPLGDVDYAHRNSPGTLFSLEGSWGGQFYGNNADFVGGIIAGGSDTPTSSGGSSYNNLLMVYTAEKNAP